MTLSAECSERVFKCNVYAEWYHIIKTQPQPYNYDSEEQICVYNKPVGISIFSGRSVSLTINIRKFRASDEENKHYRVYCVYSKSYSIKSGRYLYKIIYILHYIA